MASPLRLPTLLAATLSIGLNLAIIGTAGRSLDVYHRERYENPFFLPLWTTHFDVRGLSALIGTSSVVVLLNAVLALALFFPRLPANAIVLASSSLSTVLAVIAISFSAVLKHRSPETDTLQTWTCMWRNVPDNNVPRVFDSLCHETRFAFFTTIPSFVLQLALLALAFRAISSRTSSSTRGMRLDEEKNHELVQVHQQPFPAKS